MLHDLQRTFTNARDEIVSAVKSPDWTPEGRTKEITKAGRVARLALKTHEDKVAQATARVAELRTKALQPAARQRDTEALMLEREIRDRLMATDPMKVRLAYLDACAAGDELTWRAIDNAPGAFPLIDAATRAKGEQYRLANSAFADDLSRAEEDEMRLRLSVSATRDELSSLLGRFGVQWDTLDKV